MALFDSKKNGDKPVSKPISLPIDKIVDMRKNGLSNNQIVEALQKENYSTTQIFDAINQAELKGDTGPQGLEPMPGAPDVPLSLDPPQMEQMPPFPSPQTVNIETPSAGMSEDELVEKIEEVTETIIEEKWKDFVETVEKVIEWKSAFTERVDSMQKDVDYLKAEFDKLHTAILRKVEQYDKSMGNVGAQLKAMEMVFKDVLPKFTENVNKLSSYTKKVKKKK